MLVKKAMVAALGNSKDYSLKQYLLFANKLQTKAKVSECCSPNCQLYKKGLKYLFAIIMTYLR